VLFGDGAWAANSLARLQETGHRVVAVVVRAQPSDKSLIAAASRFDAPILQPANVNAEEFVQTVAGLDVDLNLSISYNQILRRPVRETARLGSVNFHAGKLPYYRGRNVINWAIINGEIEIGLTAHYIDDGIDTGDLILQRTLPIGWTDTYGDVLCKVVSALPDLVLEAVEMVARGRATRLPQSYLLGTYLPGRETGDEWLDWSDSSRNLHNKVRPITRPSP
jgi:methionyl-tRNA formyltransferase